MYILLAILVFGILIFTHELGHFLTAKLFGVRVNEFALFMGPAIFQKTIGETTYSLRCIPLGGFCAMEGEDESSDDPRAFTSAKPWKRAIILVAGAAMNFLTGLLVMVIIYASVSGFTVQRIDSFIEGCPLEAADGLQVGDELYRIDGRRVYIYSDVGMLLDRNTTGVFDLEVKRDGEIVRLDDFKMELLPYEIDGEIKYLYGLQFTAQEKTFGLVMKTAWYSTIDFVRMVYMGLGDLISGRVKLDDMSGPVGIVSVMAETGSASATTADAIANIAYLGAFIAVNLAVMNMLPIPALDGGRVFLLIITWGIEKITRRKLDPKYEGYIHAAGMILLLGLILVITLKDIFKLFAG